MIIFITGPSGVGKSTLRDYYCNQRGIKKTPALTTRPTRKGEIEIHKTISREEFLHLLDNGKLCLVAENHGFLYGYKKEEILNNKNEIAIFEVDSETAIKEKNHFSAIIVRIIPKNQQKSIQMIIEKRDDTKDRLNDFHNQMNEEFIAQRLIEGDLIFSNDYSKKSLNKFCDFIDQIISNNRKR
jgi:guanylate kinase